MIVALAMTIVVYGLFTLSRAHLDVFPEFSPSQVVIQTEAPGLSAELVETQVSQPIENALAGVSGLESLRSQSIPGLSVVHVFFQDGSDIYRNRQVVSERLGALTAQLPKGIVPAMTPLTSSASTVLGVGITSDKRSLMELRTLVDWTIRPHLLAVRGVAEVNVFGGDVRQWQIQVDPEKLHRYGLALDDVVAAARRATGVAGAGFVKTPNQHILLQTSTRSRGAVADVARVRARLSRRPCGAHRRRRDGRGRRGAVDRRRRDRRHARRIHDGAGPARVQYACGHAGPRRGAGGTQAVAGEGRRQTAPATVPAGQLHRDRRAQRPARHPHRLGCW